jgi:hypothetical protein
MGWTSLAVPGLIFEVAEKPVMMDQKSNIRHLRSDAFFLAAYGQDVIGSRLVLSQSPPHTFVMLKEGPFIGIRGHQKAVIVGLEIKSCL